MIKVTKLTSLNKKFKRHHGWSGADGIFSYSYKDKIIFYFSDTFIGDSDENDKRISFELINNSFATSDKKLNEIDFIYKKNPLNSYFNLDKGYYWLQDGILEDSTLSILALKMENDIFSSVPFEIKNVDLLKIDLNELHSFKYKKFDFYPVDKNIILGASIIKENGYYYIFGYINKYNNKQLILSRKKSLLDNKIEFLSQDYTFKTDTSNLLVLKENFAAEFKFIKLNNKYYCAYTKNSIGKDIYLLIVDDLFKPYENEILLYSCKEHNKDIITYNSKIQEALSNSKELVISYNVNTLINENHSSLNIYRPRFIKVSLEEISNETK